MLKNTRIIFPLVVFLLLSSLFFIQSFSVSAKDVVLSFTIGEPVCHKNLTVFPVKLKEGPAKLGLITLDEASEDKALKITEIDDGQVNAVELENVSSNWIFLLAGEIISGAKQNRVIGKDTLIPPKSGKIKELVFLCGTWKMGKRDG